MSALEALIASLAGDKLKGAGLNVGGAAPAPAATAVKPLSLEDIIKSGIIGQTDANPTGLFEPMAQSYAPHGPQLNFTGGSPFPVNETPATVHNGMVLATELAKILGEFRKKRTEAQAAAKAQSAASKGK